jgi:hypothetical protein
VGLYNLLQATSIQRNPFHIRRRNKVLSFVIIKAHVIRTYLGFNTVAIQRQLLGIPQLITETEGIKHIFTWIYTMH